MTRFWWVRHGPTHEKVFTGWRDVPADLSDHAALDRLNAYLPQDAVVISSDLVRAVATADTLSPSRSRLPHEPGLREFDFGVWDGMKFDAIAARDPELSRAFWESPGDIRAPDGESWNDVAARVSDVVTRLTRDHAGRDIIAVAHIGVIMTQIAVAQGQGAYAAMGHVIDNLSVTSMTHEEDGWRLNLVNHLP